jgi:transcriptional regulator with XRE-family HTH domain
MLDRILDLAMRRGLNQRRLEQKAGFSVGRVSKWKTKGAPNSEHLAKIASVLGTSVHYLMTGEAAPGDPFNRDPYEHAIAVMRTMPPEVAMRRLAGV